MQAVRVLQSDFMGSMKNIFTQTMCYCVEISELALNKLAQKADAEWLHQYWFPLRLISPDNTQAKSAGSELYNPHMGLFLSLLSGSQLWLCYLKTCCTTKAYICFCTASLCEVYRMAINPFIGGNAAWRLQEDGMFYMQCHTVKCVENSTDRNCNTSSSSQHLLSWASGQQGFVPPQTHKRRLETGFSTVSLQTLSQPFMEQKILGKKGVRCISNREEVFPTRRCVPLIVTAAQGQVCFRTLPTMSKSCTPRTELITWNQSSAELASENISLQFGVGQCFASGWHFQSCNIT